MNHSNGKNGSNTPARKWAPFLRRYPEAVYRSSHRTRMGAIGAVRSSEAAAVPAHKPATNGRGPPGRSTDSTTNKYAAILKRSDRPKACPMVPYQITRELSPISRAAEAAVANCQPDPRERDKTYEVTSTMLVLVKSAD